ncbi:MAG: hypothetical protein WDN06_19680 [Asticcacaulis sp.]
MAEVVANLTATGGDTSFSVPDAMPDAPQLPADPVLMARLDKIRSDEALMKLVFGGDGQQGMLFTTQLLSAFGPDSDPDGSGGEKEATLVKAFGLGDSELG